MTTVVQQAIDLLQGFSEKELDFAINVLKQIPKRRIGDDSYVCEYGYVHGEPNDETIDAIEETEEIIRKIKIGERVPMTYEEYLAETRRWLEEDDDATCRQLGRF